MRTPDSFAVALMTILAALAAPATAQYKWTDANGTVTYSDLPPPPSVMATTLPPVQRSSPQDGMLPAALRATAARHPVTLYTTSRCTPCQQARAHLSLRGIPFSERTVRTVADANAFRKAGFGENAFPTLQVGQQRGVGYEAGQWDSLLDAAGYPDTSQLPASYRPPPPRALAAPERPVVARSASGDADVSDVSDVADAEPAAETRESRRTANGSRADTPAAMPVTRTSTIRF